MKSQENISHVTTVKQVDQISSLEVGSHQLSLHSDQADRLLCQRLLFMDPFSISCLPPDIRDVPKLMNGTIGTKPRRPSPPSAVANRWSASCFVPSTSDEKREAVAWELGLREQERGRARENVLRRPGQV